jgi:hypothetical protein
MSAMKTRSHEQTLLFFVLLSLLAAPAGAQVALTGKAGTLGLGAELALGLTPQLDGRLGVNAFSYSDADREASNIHYDADAHLRTVTALLDWHPGGGSFRLTGGAVWNGTRLDGHSRPSASGTYEIGGVQVPVAIVQRLDARAEFNPVAPYAGLGWGNPIRSARRSGFALDLGVIFQGKADVKLTPVIPQSSPINTTPGAREVFDILLSREEQDLEDEASDYDLYPVVSLGFWYRF